MVAVGFLSRQFESPGLCGRTETANAITSSIRWEIRTLRSRRVQNRTLRHGSRSFGSGVPSTLSADHFAHHLSARGLQWSHAAPREEPHALILIAAVNNVDAVAHNCVLERGAGILSDEPKERFPPGIVCVTKDFVSERFEFFDAHCTN